MYTLSVQQALVDVVCVHRHRTLHRLRVKLVEVGGGLLGLRHLEGLLSVLIVCIALALCGTGHRRQLGLLGGAGFLDGGLLLGLLLGFLFPLLLLLLR